MSDSEPLIKDTRLARFVLLVAMFFVTTSIAYIVSNVTQIRELAIEAHEDIELGLGHIDKLDSDVDELNARVDRLYELIMEDGEK